MLNVKIEFYILVLFPFFHLLKLFGKISFQGVYKRLHHDSSPIVQK